jgi:DNA polymerase (family 10)
LGITSVEELKAAAEAGQVRNLKGFGPKTEQRLLELISTQAEKPKLRLHLHHALNTAEQIIEYVKTFSGLVDVSFAGSLRRWKETVGTVEIVASSKKPEALLEHFLSYPVIVSSERNGSENCTAQFVDGAHVSFTAVTPAEFPVTLFLKTGSEAHLAGLPKVEFAKTPKTEDEIYKRLRMQYVPPELRENEGEIEAALAGKLPEDLVTLDDIKGMTHCHTTYSDGKHTLEQMVRGAEAMGMKYITITDHSPTAFYAGGVKLDDLRRQWDEIDELQDQVKIKILRGTDSTLISQLIEEAQHRQSQALRIFLGNPFDSKRWPPFTIHNMQIENQVTPCTTER